MSNKYSIEWHEGCLKNWESNMVREDQRAERILAELADQRKRLEFYRRQITEAKKQRKDGFDLERFLKGTPR